jgi:hypothetical protein
MDAHPHPGVVPRAGDLIEIELGVAVFHAEHHTAVGRAARSGHAGDVGRDPEAQERRDAARDVEVRLAAGILGVGREREGVVVEEHPADRDGRRLLVGRTLCGGRHLALHEQGEDQRGGESNEA